MRMKDNPQAPLVSVIVPIYNVADHVAACVQSVLAQRYRSFELIAVDDGSTDDSLSIARQVSEGDNRVRFIQQANAGLSAARNAGLDVIRGRFVCFLDSDDRLAPGFLERMMTTVLESQADWVACGVRFCFADGNEEYHSAIHGAPELEGFDGLRREALSDWRDVVRLFPSAWNKVYRRDLISGLRFDEGLYFEDHPFYYRCAARSESIVLLPEPLYLHTRGRNGQITEESSDRVFQQFEILERMRGIMEKSGKSGAEEAFQQIATRLTFERSQAIRDPELKARFIARTKEYVMRPDPALGVAPSWILAIS